MDTVRFSSTDVETLLPSNDMNTFSSSLAICAAYQMLMLDSKHQGSMMQTLTISFLLAGLRFGMNSRVTGEATHIETYVKSP